MFLYSTYFGGSGVDYGQAIAVNALQQAYVPGTTNTPFFPLSGPGGVDDGFVARFHTTLIGAASCGGRRRFGGTDNESIHDIAVQPNGVAYVTGASASSNFPTTPGVIQPNDPTPGGVSSHYDAVIVKFSAKMHRGGHRNGPHARQALDEGCGATRRAPQVVRNGCPSRSASGLRGCVRRQARASWGA